MVQLPPGDFATHYVQTILGAGQGVGASGNIRGDPAIEAQLRSDFGLDQPVPVQYLRWLQRIVTGNWGMSFAFNRPISEVIADRLTNTVILAVGTILLTWTLAIPIGIYSAVHHNTPQDYAVTFIGFLGLAVPNFLLGLILLWLGALVFGWEIGGLYSPEYLQQRAATGSNGSLSLTVRPREGIMRHARRATALERLEESCVRIRK